jgi:purine-binding chemotaxis protein CheW
MNKFTPTTKSFDTVDIKNSKEFLVFQLNKEEYGVDIMKVQEIRQADEVIRIANSLPFIPGVMRLDKEVIPLVDLRIMFHLPVVENNKVIMVIIVNLENNRIIGVIVDSVSDVVRLDNSQIKSTPEFVITSQNNYIQGIGLFDTRHIVVLDIEKLLSVVEINDINEIDFKEKS